MYKIRRRKNERTTVQVAVAEQLINQSVKVVKFYYEKKMYK